MTRVKFQPYRQGDSARSEKMIADAREALEKLNELDQRSVVTETYAYARLSKDNDILLAELEEARSSLKLPNLRDQFAMAAVTGLLSADQSGTWENFAAEAYRIADAMLEARKATTKNEEHA